MSRRIENFYLYELKVGGRRSTSWNEAHETLQMLLAQNMEPAARRRFGHRAWEVAYVASQIAMDRIRACRMFYDSSAYERDLLTDAYRKLPRRQAKMDVQQAPAPGEATTGLKPEWYSALQELITLSHRSWSYVYLCQGRDVPPCWKARVAAAYLERTPKGRIRHSTLTHDLVAYQAVMDELETALDRTTAGDAVDRMERLLETMDGQVGSQSRQDASVGKGPCVNRAQIAEEVLELLADRRPAEGFLSARYPALARGLDEVVARLGDINAVPDAVVEVSREASSPGCLLTAQADIQALSVFQVLDALPKDHRHERPVADVLAQIADQPVKTPLTSQRTGRATEIIRRNDLLRICSAKLEFRSPQWAVYVGLVLGYGLGGARDLLRNWLPAPADMLPRTSDWLEVAREVLEHWRGVLDRIEQSRGEAADPHYPPAWLEIPEELRGYDQQQAHQRIGSAILTLDGWLQEPHSAPQSWRATHASDGVKDQMEPVIRAALFVAVMEDLVENMSLIHRARRSRKDVFIRSILGRQPADPGSWPPPDEVVARLEDLDAS